MKKTRLILGGLLFAAILGSCDKDLKDKDNFGPASLNNGALATNVASTPVSDDGIIPYIIPGANNGGNRTCAEVAEAFDATFDYCGNKVDYGNINMPGAFPHGLEVTVTMGKYVAFTMDDCVKIGDYYYKVGAVIVKGSSAANVYFYPGGTLGDSGLAAPINSSGTPAGLSNLTFCYILCEEEENIIAIKSWYYNAQGAHVYCLSSGPSAFPGSSDWCWNLGYQDYTPGTFDMVIPGTTTKVGQATVESDGDVTVKMDGGLILDATYVFVGTMEDLTNISGCPVYTSWPSELVNGNSQTVEASQF